jgi:threonine aldolase
MFTPTGSMANQIAVQLLVPAGSELICDADAHVLTYEGGAAAAYGGISSRTWPACGADIDVDVVSGMIRPDGYTAVPTRAIAVEQTHNRGGGAVIPLSTLEGLRRVADGAGIALHCDAARIWHASIADGVPVSVYGGLFETVAVCLSKGLGAPAGSLVVSSAERIEQGRLIRRRMGGGMRQAGILAAGGLYAIHHHVDRLAQDHLRARRLAEALAPYGIVDTAKVRTNMVILDFGKSTVDARAFEAAAQASGVLISCQGPRTIRLVTHLDLDDAAVDRAIGVLTGLLAG